MSTCAAELMTPNDSVVRQERDELSPADRRLMVKARQLIRAYERHAHDRRSAAYREAHDALLAFVRARGGWIQLDGLRFRWDRGDSMIRTRVRPFDHKLPAPLKV